METWLFFLLLLFWLGNRHLLSFYFAIFKLTLFALRYSIKNSCGKVIGNLWDKYLSLLSQDYTEG